VHPGDALAGAVRHRPTTFSRLGTKRAGWRFVDWELPAKRQLMPRRHIFHSTLTRRGWEVREGGESLSQHRNQKECERAAIAAARRDCRQGVLAEAVLHKRDGSVRAQRTFATTMPGGQAGGQEPLAH
jgi:hypothetical protein